MYRLLIIPRELGKLTERKALDCEYVSICFSSANIWGPGTRPCVFTHANCARRLQPLINTGLCTKFYIFKHN